MSEFADLLNERVMMTVDSIGWDSVVDKRRFKWCSYGGAII